MPVPDHFEDRTPERDFFFPFCDLCAEVDDAIELLREDVFSVGDRPTLLDFGCNNGDSTCELADHGFEVVGYDSCEVRIAQARHQAERRENPARFVSGTMGFLLEEFGSEHFESIVSLSFALNRLTTIKDISRHLRILRAMLAPGGRFLMHLWNGAAHLTGAIVPEVAHAFDSEEKRREVIRILSPEVDRVEQSCRLSSRTLLLDHHTGEFQTFEAEHDYLVLTPLQYRHLFDLNDLRILKEFPTGKPASPVTDQEGYLTYLLTPR